MLGKRQDRFVHRRRIGMQAVKDLGTVIDGEGVCFHGDYWGNEKSDTNVP
jgi:hypothetical protein